MKSRNNDIKMSDLESSKSQTAKFTSFETLLYLQILYECVVYIHGANMARVRNLTGNI